MSFSDEEANLGLQLQMEERLPHRQLLRALGFLRRRCLENFFRIESGADANIYKITVYTNSSTVTLANMNGTAFFCQCNAGFGLHGLGLGNSGSQRRPGM